MPETENPDTTSPRDLATEKEIFLGRSEEIRGLLQLDAIKAVLMKLAERPQVLDLLTGTGAGLQAVYEVLVSLGKNPVSMFGVDKFTLEWRLTADAVDSLNRSKYSLSMEETRRNLQGLSVRTNLTLVQQDVFDYLKGFVQDRGLIPFRSFDLITGFAVPLNQIDDNKIIWMLKIIDQLGRRDMVPILTIGSSHQRSVTSLIGSFKQPYGIWGWNIYKKPRGSGPLDWDCWILTNKQLELESIALGR